MVLQRNFSRDNRTFPLGASDSTMDLAVAITLSLLSLVAVTGADIVGIGVVADLMRLLYSSIFAKLSVICQFLVPHCLSYKASLSRYRMFVTIAFYSLTPCSYTVFKRAIC